MGWVFTHRPKGQSTIDFFKQRFDHEGGEVLDAATRGPTEAYLAWQIRDRTTGQVKGVVGIACQTRWRHGDY